MRQSGGAGGQKITFSKNCSLLRRALSLAIWVNKAKLLLFLE
jgi:hypothetical protein